MRVWRLSKKIPPGGGGGATIFSQFSGKVIGGGGCYKTPVNMLLYKVNTNKTIDHLMQYF